jgi:hypothetical protein
LRQREDTRSPSRSSPAHTLASRCFKLPCVANERYWLMLYACGHRMDSSKRASLDYAVIAHAELQGGSAPVMCQPKSVSGQWRQSSHSPNNERHYGGLPGGAAQLETAVARSAQVAVSGAESRRKEWRQGVAQIYSGGQRTPGQNATGRGRKRRSAEAAP